MNVYFITIAIAIFSSYFAQLFGHTNNSNVSIVIINNKIFVFLTGVILASVAGLRWNVGTDYWQYSVNYIWYVEDVWKDIMTFSEPGINIISRFGSIFFNDYAAMFFLSSAITIGLTVSTVSKYSKFFTFSICLYIFIGAWHGSFNGVRQYLAAAVLFAGHRYITNRKFKHFLLIIVIASMFHITAIGMIVLYFVPLTKLKLKHLAMLMGITLLIIFSYSFLFEIMETLRGTNLRTQGYMTRQVNLNRILVSVAPLMIYYAFTNKDILSSRDYFYINMLFVNAVVVLSTYNSAYLMRFAIYTNMFSLLGIPSLINNRDIRIRFLIKSITLLLYFIFWYVEVSNNISLNNFQWIFNR